MKAVLQIVSLIGLLLTIVPSILFFLGEIAHQAQNTWMFAGAVIWFISASLWLGKKKVSDPA